MIEDCKSMLKSPDSRTLIDKISRVADELSVTNDTAIFIQEMVSLNTLLNEFKQPSLTMWGAPDEKLQDPTYFIATYFDTTSIHRALWVDKIIGLLAKYILLYDRFFETDNQRYTLLAKMVRA